MKKNKLLIVAIIVFIIFILLVAGLLMLVTKGRGKGEYGERLNGIEDVKITSEIENEIIKTFENLDKVESAKYKLRGKIINVILTVSDDLDVETAKSYSAEILKILDEEQLKFYDIQIYYSSNTESSQNYPFIGYKNKSKEEFAW